MHIIDQILLDDQSEPIKQRHKASKIYRRLRDEYGYKGGYDQVRRYVKKHRKQQRETFIPLAHEPGQRLETDFGHIYVDFPDGNSALILAATRLRLIAETRWGTRRYMNMNRLREMLT